MTTQRKKTAYIVGIAGGTGSGKTTVVREIVNKVGRDIAVILQHDSYYRDRAHLSPQEREDVNYDQPDALETSLLISHLKALLDGSAIDVPIYDYFTHTRKQNVETVESRPIIIVEGIMIFADQGLRDLMDLKVFVDTDAHLRFIRRLERDMRERGRTRQSVVEQYLSSVKPMHDKVVEPSKRYADIIVPGSGYNAGVIGFLVSKVEAILAELCV